MTYQGWTNEATWLVNLHISNDYGSYRYFQDLIEMYSSQGMSKQDARINLQDALDEYLESQVDESYEILYDKYPMIADWLGCLNSMADTFEIADAMLDEYKPEPRSENRRTMKKPTAKKKVPAKKTTKSATKRR